MRLNIIDRNNCHPINENRKRNIRTDARIIQLKQIRQLPDMLPDEIKPNGKARRQYQTEVAILPSTAACRLLFNAKL